MSVKNKFKIIIFLVLLFIIGMSSLSVSNAGETEEAVEEWPSLGDEKVDVPQYPSITGAVVSVEKTSNPWKNYVLYLSALILVYALFRVLLRLKSKKK